MLIKIICIYIALAVPAYAEYQMSFMDLNNEYYYCMVMVLDDKTVILGTTHNTCEVKVNMDDCTVIIPKKEVEK